MSQYQGKPIFGITQLPVPKFSNKEITHQMLHDMNDGYKDTHKGKPYLKIEEAETRDNYQK